MKNIIAKPTKKEEADLQHDIMMLHRVEKYQISDSQYAALKHFMEKAAPEKREELTRNYINVLIGSAVMDYENVHVRKRTDIKVWHP